MNVGELFVSLGVKGTDKTIGAITGVRQGLKDTASVSLEAKAAIIGAMYALQRLFATSGKVGTDLTNFNALMGGGMIQTLQKYQYAGRQVGVTNDAMAGTFKSLQSAMTKTLMGEGAPKGLGRVSMLVGDISAQDIDKFAKQPHLLLQKLQEYANKETNAGLKREVLNSFGLGDDMQAALARNAFRPEVLAKAPAYSDGQVAELDKANIAWSNLMTKIEMAFGKLNAKFGGKLVTDISKIVDEVLKLSEAFLKLAEKAKFFEAIGLAFKGWTEILKAATDATEAITGALNDPKKAAALDKKISGFVGDDVPEMTGFALDIIKDKLGDIPELFNFARKTLMDKLPESSPEQKKAQGEATRGLDEYRSIIGGAKPVPTAPTGKVIPFKPAQPTVQPSAAAPKMPAIAPAAGSTTNVNVNQNLNFQHDGKDHKRTGDSVKKAVETSYRQLSSQSQVT